MMDACKSRIRRSGTACPSQRGAVGRAEQYQYRLQRPVGAGPCDHRSLSPGMAAGQRHQRRETAEDWARSPSDGGRDSKEAFIGQRAFGVWYRNLMLLWRKHGNPLTSYPIPEDFAAAVKASIVIVGTPDEVCEGLKREIGISGVNYMLTRFAFGDLSHEESVHSLSLFTGKSCRNSPPHRPMPEAKD